MISDAEVGVQGPPSDDFGQSFWRAAAVVPQPLLPISAASSDEATFRMLADNIPTLCWMANADGYVAWYNRRWHQYCGTRPEEVEGWGWQSVHDPDLLPLVMERWTACIAAGEPFEMTVPLRGADGIYRPFLTRAQPVRDEAGAVVRWFGVSTEISGQLEAEVELARRKTHLEAVFEQSAAGLCETDRSGRFTRVNDRFCQITGRSREELMQLRMHDITHPDDLAGNEPSFRQTVDTGTSFEIEKRYIRPDGSTVWVHNSVTALRQPDGTLAGTICVSVDVTGLKWAEERLLESETRLQLAVDAAHMAVWESDVRSGAVRGSPQLNRLLGFPEDESLDLEKIRACYFPGEIERVAEAGQQALSHPERFGEVEFRYCPPSGGLRWLLLRAQAQVDSNGEPLSFIGVMMDITQRKRAEEHQRLLVNELNHRVKNTLAIVQAVAQQSFKGTALPKEAREAFEGRLAALSTAHDLLTRQNWEAAPIHQIIRDGVGVVESNGDRVRTHGPDLLLAPQTAVSLAMAVHELATNALKYGSLSRPEGTVHLTWRVEDERLRLQWKEQGGPAVSVPDKRGFGTRLIEAALASELSGEVRIEFKPEGLICTVDAPIPREG